MRAIIENMISLDHVSCHTPGFGNFQGGERIENFDFFGDFEHFRILWKIASCNFQSRGQIMTLGGVFRPK